jgi:riboflavin synthase
VFTGIIEEVGTVRRSEAGVLVVECRVVLESSGLGDSIAINGCDLTVAEMTDDSMTFNCMPETYRRSNLGELKPGDPVNLERSVTLSTRLSGHLVRGVVEATGKLLSLTPEGDAILAHYSAPPDILRHMIVKGPITIDGASLTVIAKDAKTFTVSLVQYTQEHTSHVSKKPGDSVNLETDIIARYVDQLLSERETA